MEAQEVEAVLTAAEVNDAGLVGVQTQPELGQHRLDPATGLLGPAPAGGEDHEVVRIADQRPQAGRRRPRLVETMQGDVGQQRGDARAIGVPVSLSETSPPSNTPARSQLRSSFNICRSITRRST